MIHLCRIVALILLATCGYLWYTAYNHSVEFPSAPVESAQLKECYTRLEHRGSETYYCRFESVKTGQEQNTVYTRGAWMEIKSHKPGTNFIVEVEYPDRKSDNAKMVTLGILALIVGLIFVGLGIPVKKEEE